MQENPITNTNIEEDKNVSDQGTTQVNLKEESQNVDKGKKLETNHWLPSFRNKDNQSLFLDGLMAQQFS